MVNKRVIIEIVVTAALSVGCGPGTGAASAPTDRSHEKVLRVVPMADLTILDPTWTTAGITRNHGYMVYDTLFGMDADHKISPQMVDTYEVSPDKKTWTFNLREGLTFHDGAPVTSDDVIASLKRWGQKDSMGQRLLSFVERWQPLNARTFRMELKAPYGLVLESLAKPEANVPFVMPRRIAEAPPDKKIDDPTGSGPFILKQENWRPGEKVVYLRNPAYKPRPEPASGTAGGKVVKVDRVEWIIIKDPQTQAIALATGEVDMITNPSFEQYAAFKTSPDIQLLDATAYNAQYTLIFNHRQPPFDNPKVRRAAMAALNQPAFLQTQVGVPGTYRVCFSVYPCSTPYATSKGMDLLANPSLERAQQLLKESGYHGEAVVVLHPTDFAIIAKLPVVASQLLRQAGFRVDMQSMDWSTLQARRSRLEGWNVFLTAWTEAGLLDPVTANVLSGACHPQAWFGWPCDSELEKLRHAFAVAEGENERKAIAEQVQVRAMEIASYVPLGEYRLVPVARRNVKGVVPGFQLVLWNLEKE